MMDKIIIEQLKEIWKITDFDELMKENIRMNEQIEQLERQIEYWDKEYVKQDKKAEGYREKYLKWKKKTKELRDQRQQGMRRIKRISRCKKCNKYGHKIQDCKEMNRKCYTCREKGHKQKDCYKNQVYE